MSEWQTEKFKYAQWQCWASSLALERLGVNVHQACNQLAKTLLVEFDSHPILFKDNQASTVRKCYCLDRWWVVKFYRKPAWKNILYHWARRTSAWKEWYGARQLAHANVRAIEPAMLACRGLLGRQGQMLVLPFIDAPDLDQWVSRVQDGEALTRDQCDVRRKVARMVGKQIGQLAASGIVNRDHKPSNLLIDEGVELGHIAPTIIDLDGLRKRRHDDQIIETMLVMLRSAKRVGKVQPTEAMHVLKAMLEADPTIAQEQRCHRLKYLAKEVQHRLDIFYTQYDPKTFVPRT